MHPRFLGCSCCPRDFGSSVLTTHQFHRAHVPHINARRLSEKHEAAFDEVAGVTDQETTTNKSRVFHFNSDARTGITATCLKTGLERVEPDAQAIGSIHSTNGHSIRGNVILQVKRRRQALLTVLVCVSAAAVGCDEGAILNTKDRRGLTGPGENRAITIQITPSTLAVEEGAVTAASCVAKDSEGTVISSSPSWGISDQTIAIIAENGSITGHRIGNAVVSCTVDGRSATAPLTVLPSDVEFVEVTPGAGVVVIAGSIQLVAVPRDSTGASIADHGVQWLSSDSMVAAVTATGNVIGRAEGTVNITALSGGKSSLSRITVAKQPPTPVESISVRVDESSLEVGQLAHATATTYDTNGGAVSGRSIVWSVSPPSVVSAVSAGEDEANVTGVGEGTSVLTATSEGKSASVRVTVTAAPVQTPATGTLASHNFDDGTLGPFYNPWGSGVDVVDDPAGSGHEKVARFHYAADGVVQTDDNLALFPNQSISIGLGETIWFQGDFYIPADADLDPAHFPVRKLLYWGWAGHGGGGFPHEFSTTPALMGDIFSVGTTVIGPSNIGSNRIYLQRITFGVWHRLKLQIRLPTSFSATDGIYRIWLDGALVFDNKNVLKLTDPRWTDEPSTYKWVSWGFGWQMDAHVAFDEFRYWDNVTFSVTPPQP